MSSVACNSHCWNGTEKVVAHDYILVYSFISKPHYIAGLERVCVCVGRAASYSAEGVLLLKETFCEFVSSEWHLAT